MRLLKTRKKKIFQKCWVHTGWNQKKMHSSVIYKGYAVYKKWCSFTINQQNNTWCLGGAIVLSKFLFITIQRYASYFFIVLFFFLTCTHICFVPVFWVCLYACFSPSSFLFFFFFFLPAFYLTGHVCICSSFSVCFYGSASCDPVQSNRTRNGPRPGHEQDSNTRLLVRVPVGMWCL